MRSLFPAAFACAVALAACGGVTERGRPQATGGTAAGSPAPPAGSGALPAIGTGGGPPVAEACVCADVEIGWWVQRAGAQPETEAHITPCNSFSYGPAGAPECETLLDDCTQVFNLRRLYDALAQSDVRHALEQAPVVYGRDLRNIGGQVDHMDIGGKVIEVGDECNGTDPCPIPIPDGVAELAHLLGRITLEQRGTCVDQ